MLEFNCFKNVSPDQIKHTSTKLTHPTIKEEDEMGNFSRQSVANDVMSNEEAFENYDGEYPEDDEIGDLFFN